MTTAVSPITLARAADEAARAVPGVLDLSSGAVGEFATYGAGQRVAGVRVKIGDSPRVSLRLVAQFGRSLPDLADEVRDRVRASVEPLFPASPVTVELLIADVALQSSAPHPSELPSTTT